MFSVLHGWDCYINEYNFSYADCYTKKYIGYTNKIRLFIQNIYYIHLHSRYNSNIIVQTKYVIHIPGGHKDQLRSVIS